MLLLLTLFWFVQFTDKLGSAPIQFSDRATENRILWSVDTDSLDYAVVPAYLDSVRAKGAKVCHVSRWMNGCTIEGDSTVAEAIGQLPFVAMVEQTRNDNYPTRISQRKFARTETATDPYRDNGQQLDVYNLRPLHQLGYEGQGIRIAVIDIGFSGADTASCLQAATIVGTYDFSSDTASIYSPVGQHGSNCLSFIAAQTSTYHGAATEAEFILIRSEEIYSESPKECDNLIAAMELCDSLGVNILTVSLGYCAFDNPAWNYTYADMNGRTTRVSRAAAIAARKGMLLCLAAGNEGNKTWHHICAPSDADSVLTVGACGTDSVMGAFSSYGPAVDGRVKPEVSAVGVQATYWHTISNQATAGNGTSYATPLMAGLAACLWSAYPNESARQIRQRIIESAHLYPGSDTNHQMGYGIPDAWKAYQSTPTWLKEEAHPIPYTKFIYQGHLYIVREGKVYTIFPHETQKIAVVGN